VGSRLRSNPYLWAFLAGIVTLTLIRPLLRRVPPLPPVLFQSPPFTLVASDGKPFGSQDLAGQVYVAGFFFTRCQSICPMLTQAMGRLSKLYDEADVGIRLVSITVDPEYDTPQVLAAYAAEHGIDGRRWKLLTGERQVVEPLVTRGFKMAMGPIEGEPGAVDIAHSGKLLLVDKTGGVRGVYATDEEGLDELFHRSLHVLRAR
jgi:protein SCO1